MYGTTPETRVHTLTSSWQLVPSFTQPWWKLGPHRNIMAHLYWRIPSDNISAVTIVRFRRSASAILPTTFICVGGIQLFLLSEPCTVPAVSLTVAMFTHIAALCIYFRPFCTQYTGDKCNDLHGYNFTAVKTPPPPPTRRKANFNREREGGASMPPGIAGAGGYRVVNNLTEEMRSAAFGRSWTYHNLKSTLLSHCFLLD